MEKILFLFLALSLCSCRYIDYSTPDDRHLTMINFGLDTKVGNLEAKAGDTSIVFKNYESDVNPETVKALNDAIVLALEIAKKMPSGGFMMGPTTQPNELEKTLTVAKQLADTLPKTRN